MLHVLYYITYYIVLHYIVLYYITYYIVLHIALYCITYIHVTCYCMLHVCMLRTVLPAKLDLKVEHKLDTNSYYIFDQFCFEDLLGLLDQQFRVTVTTKFSWPNCSRLDPSYN